MLNWLRQGLGPVADLLLGWMSRRAEQKAAEHEARLRVIEANIDYDVEAQRQRPNTWLDEAVGIWLLILFTLGMFDSDVLANIQKFKDFPEFLQWSFMMMVGALFGWRTVLGPLLSKRAGVKMIGTETNIKQSKE